MNKFIFLIIACGFLTLSARTQGHFKIRGQLMSENTSEVLPYANMQLFDQQGKAIKSAVSGSKGHFLIKDIPAGDYVLQFSYLSFQAYSLMIQNAEAKDLKLGKIRLKPINYHLQAVDIQAHSNDVDIKIDRRIINVSEQVHAAGGTAADILQADPAIQVDAQGCVLLRGSSDFQLLIDGRPSVMSAEDALQQMQAEPIQKIEIITTPSAKYEAEGNTGIINIITKKDYLSSAEGMLRLSLATESKYSADLLFNRKFNKLRWYAGFSYSDKTKLNQSFTERNISKDNTNQVFDSQREVRRKLIEFSTGTDYNWNEKNSLGFNFRLGQNSYFLDIPATYRAFPDSSFIESLETYENKNNYLTMALFSEHHFAGDGHKLMFDFYFRLIENEQKNDYQEMKPAFERKINISSDKKKYRLKLDYERSFSKSWTMETGLFAAFNYSNDFSEMNPDPLDTSSYSGKMVFRESVYAGYFSLLAKLGSFKIKAGLRAEFDDRRLDMDFAERNYDGFYLFPSLHLSTKLFEKHKLSLAYSRRINRPDEWQLSPFVHNADRFLIRKGNPDLLPEFTDAIELGYYAAWQKFRINTQMYYHHLKHSIYNYVMDKGNLFYESYTNLDRMDNSGAELMLSYSPFRWLRLNLQGTAYYSSWDETKIKHGSIEEGDALVSHASFRSTFLFDSNTYLQFLAIYYAPSDMPQGRMEQFYYFDFILRRQFLSKKLSLSFRTHNTFDTGLMKYTVFDKGFESRTEYKYEGPTLILSLSYTLNNFRNNSQSRDTGIDFDSRLDH